MSRVFVYVGLALIAVAAADWVITGVQSVLFVMSGLCLIALGALKGLDDSVDQGQPGEPPE